METYYYVSANDLNRGQTVKTYGRTENFRMLYDFCSSLVENDPDNILLVSVVENFMKAKGISFPNPYSLSTMLREVLAEEVRRVHFPDRPSRLGSVFVFKNYMDAYQFRSDYRNGKGIIYRCQSVARKAFTGDMAIITYAQLSPHQHDSGFQEFKKAMLQYWAGEPPMKYPETICSDPVVIVEPAHLAYQYDPLSGKFIAALPVPLDPSGQPVLPVACTYEAPVFAPGKTPVYKNGVWSNQ